MLTNAIPAYGGKADLSTHFIRNIDRNDSATVVSITLQSHFCPTDLLRNVPPDADILLFQARWSTLRKDPVYTSNNPGIHPDIGLAVPLRVEAFDSSPCTVIGAFHD